MFLIKPLYMTSAFASSLYSMVIVAWIVSEATGVPARRTDVPTLCSPNVCGCDLSKESRRRRGRFGQ